MLGDMSEDWHEIYRQEAGQLGEVGLALRGQDIPEVTVRLPMELAERAVASWTRDSEEGGHEVSETPDERVTRHRAGTLALIGIAIQERGQADGQDVVVPLHPGMIGLAMDAADD